MGRGVSCGGGQSSLGYLFGNGGGETDNNSNTNTQPPPEIPTEDATPQPEPTETSPETSDDNNNNAETEEPSENDPSDSYSIINQNPNTTSHDSTTNNYHRADGQNCGNFITNRPSTKVHAAPGGESSIGFLFCGKKN